MKVKHLLPSRKFINTFGKSNFFVCIFCLCFFLILSWQVKTGKINALDEYLLERIHNILPLWFVYISKGFYFLGEAEVAVFVVLFSLGFLCWKKYWEEAIALATSTGIVLLLIDKILKPLFNRERPLERLVDNINGKSFPSGHASGNLLLYFLLAYMLSSYFPKFKVYFYAIAVIITIFMGLGSAYLRVHWVTDILGAYCVGYILYSIAITFLKMFNQKLSVDSQ